MKKAIKILILLLIPCIGVSQINDSSYNQRFLFGINIGLNFSKFNSDSINFYSGTKPLIGLHGKYKINENIYFKSSISYSLKGSTSISPYLKLRNSYIDFNFTSQHKIIKSLYLQAGISYSRILSSKKITLDGESKNGVDKVNFKGFNSEISIITGVEFCILDNINIEFNYNIPTSKTNIKNFQFTLNVLLNKKRLRKESYRQINQKKSKEQIRQLRNGTLLVRLKTSKSKISALRKIGEIAKADKIEKQQEIENKKIISAFNKDFNFCNVVFFFSNKSKNIVNREFENIFLNDNLKIDNSIKIDTNNSIFIADFSRTHQDTTKYFSHYSYDHKKDKGLRKVENYFGGTNFGLDEMVIKDDNFIQLNKPFPFYTKIVYKSIKRQPEQSIFKTFFHMAHLTRSYKKTVEKINKKLLKYYYRSK